MGLACKNAILIVEFARELEHQGRDIVEAALEACRLRLRPILMTSFAFIMGVLPLVFASRRRRRDPPRDGRDGVPRHARRDLLRPVPDAGVLRGAAQAAARRTSAAWRASWPWVCIMPRAPLAVAVRALLAACTVGPRHVARDAAAGGVRPGHARGRRGAAARGLEGLRQPGARCADRARARGQPHHRAGSARLAEDARAVAACRSALVPDRHRRRRAAQEPPAATIRSCRIPATPRPIAPASTRPGRSTCSAACATSRTRSTAREADAAALAERGCPSWPRSRRPGSRCAARARLAIQRRNLENLREDLAILQARVDAGSRTSSTSRAHAGAGVAASLPQSEAEVARQEQRLAVLTAWPSRTARARCRSRRDPGAPRAGRTGTPGAVDPAPPRRARGRTPARRGDRPTSASSRRSSSRARPDRRLRLDLAGAQRARSRRRPSA